MSGRGRGAGGPQRFQNRQPQPRYAGTGSNGTPLGTPKMRSPVAGSPQAEPTTTTPKAPVVPEIEPSKVVDCSLGIRPPNLRLL